MNKIISRAIEWIGGHELTVIVALLAVIGGTWAFVAIADEVSEGDLQKLEDRLVIALRTPEDPRVPVGPAWLAEAGRDLTALGGFAVLVLVTLAVLVFLWLDGRFHALVFVAIAVVGGFFLTFGLKNLFERPRPDLVPHLSHVVTASFPSGHSMMSATVYLTLGALLSTQFAKRRIKFFLLALPLLITGLTGCSRVYLGVHYPSDVLAGWAAGLAWAALCLLVAFRLQKRGQVEPPK